MITISQIANKSFELSDEIMQKINKFTRRELTSDEVYAFPVILCDNEIDRDGECFSVSALEKLKELFVGKTGIFDHNPKGENQTARIFDTQIIEDCERKTSTGENYVYLEGKAYILRSEKNKELIGEIDGGIKKEVSVSVSVEKEICSICHQDRRKKMCAHIKGKMYGNSVCHVILDSPSDAYEFSFVAIPAQKNAGVIKSFVQKSLLDEVVELYYLCDTVLTKGAIEKMLSKRSEEELKVLKSSLEKRLAKRVIPQTLTNFYSYSLKGVNPYTLN